ncbi:MAG: YbhB/YbcL family Raf kinase inhibitor-like protein [Candidatus Syntropharchaeales archaeon]
MVRYKLFAVVFALIALATFSIGCMESINIEEARPTITLIDDLGREVTIPQNPERIVSLAPSTTEIVFAIGAGDRVVGVDEISNYPPEVEAIPKVGSYATINTERVVDLDPDLVLAAYGNGIETIDTLSDLGVPVIGLNPTTLNETLQSINLVGEATGCEENATMLTSNMRMQIDAVKAAAAKVAYEPSVLYVIWHDPLYSAGNGTFEDEMMRICRAKNIASDLPGYSIMTLENVIKRDPEVIITTSGGGMGVEETNLSYDYITTDPRFAGIKAVKDGKVYVIDADIACRPGPRIVDALKEIFGYIHPELQNYINEEGIEKNGMRLTSTAFEEGGMIPSRYTCDGEDINPPLKIEEVPEGAVTLVLIVDDPDAPMGTWDHWLVWNIPIISTIEENSVPGVQGKNSWGRNDYGGPCPPSGTHRYFFKLYAIDTTLDIGENSTKEDLESAMEGHILSHTHLVGLYSRA